MTIQRIIALGRKLGINNNCTEELIAINYDYDIEHKISYYCILVEESLAALPEPPNSISIRIRKPSQYQRNMWLYNQRKTEDERVQKDEGRRQTSKELCKALKMKIDKEQLKNWTPLKTGKSLDMTLARFITKQKLPSLEPRKEE